MYVLPLRTTRERPRPATRAEGYCLPVLASQSMSGPCDLHRSPLVRTLCLGRLLSAARGLGSLLLFTQESFTEHQRLRRAPWLRLCNQVHTDTVCQPAPPLAPLAALLDARRFDRGHTSRPCSSDRAPAAVLCGSAPQVLCNRGHSSDAPRFPRAHSATTALVPCLCGACGRLCVVALLSRPALRARWSQPSGSLGGVRTPRESGSVGPRSVGSPVLRRRCHRC